jgi:sensor histidine kinase regulating citrate/malate metabolism
LFINVIANCYYNLIFERKPSDNRFIEAEVSLSEDKTAIQIKISDTGPDMTRSGYQKDKDSPFRERGKIGGVNLGLAHFITHDHNGKLTVESYEKGGTTFIINLPVAQKGQAT